MRIPIVKIVPVKRSNKTAYQVDYRLNGKRFRYIVAHSKKDSEIIRAKIQQELTLGIHGITPSTAKAISLDDLIYQYLQSKVNLVRTSTYNRYVNYFDGFKKFMHKYFSAACGNIRYINEQYLQECFNRLSKEPVNKSKAWHHNTINILQDLLIEMFNLAVTDKYIDSNPVLKTTPFKTISSNNIKYYTDAQLKTIWDNLDPHWIPVMKFLSYTGLRKNEIF
jgi:hypothetical protein